MKTVYLNGEFLPLSEAKISVLDRGFLFGDGIYEVIPVYNNKIFRLKEHFKRLANSLKNINLTMPLSEAEFTKVFETLIEKNSDLGPQQVIYLQITRGADGLRAHDIPTHLKPTIFAQTSQRPTHEKTELNGGKKAITLNDIRWQNCFIKATSLLPNILLNQQAKDADACEAILLRDGMLTEGASSNIFIVKNNVVYTPPLSNNILGGITRDLVIQLAKENDITVEEKQITEQELRDADEVWVSSSMRELFPITTLDNKPVGNGKSGPIWSKMYDYYCDYTTSF